MTNTQDLLIEIGTEELPAKHQNSLADALCQNLLRALDEENLSVETHKIFSTPRRIAVLLKNIPTQQAAQKKEKLGPSIDKAFDKEGMPTIACMGFARSSGISVDQLKTIETPKGKRVGVVVEVAGQATADILPLIIEEQIKKLPITKPMRWGDNSFEFIRPVHWLIALFGDTSLNHSLFNLKISRHSRGHRFHHPQSVSIDTPESYEEQLLKAHVMACFKKRRGYIKQELLQAEQKNRVIMPQKLLDEVSSLVEWPVILKGCFEGSFLKIPREALITSMQSHQKVFAIEDHNGKLLPEFLIVSNIKSKDPNQVIQGNEKVIRARLSDAEFFFKKDLSTKLESRSKALKNVIFQEKLGSIHSKGQRIEKLLATLSAKQDISTNQAARAAKLCKCDLLTEMVGEFPSLQGTMGGYYARHDQEEEVVAAAIEEHYLPRFSHDRIPQTTLGCLLSISDKIDTLVGIFGIKQQPTGVKDPFALRRAALAVLRTIIEKSLPIDLMALIKKSIKTYGNTLIDSDIAEKVFDFMQQRLKAYYAEKGIPPNVYLAVNALTIHQPHDFQQRIIAVEHFQTLNESESLTQANKRVANILKKQKKIGSSIRIQPTLLLEDAEKNLVSQLNSKIALNCELNQAGQYSASLTELASLKEPIDNFFNEVMIMTDDVKLRNNRLAILQQIHDLFSQVADLSQLG